MKSILESEDFGSCLIGIACNEVRNYWRKRARRENVMERFRAEIERATVS